MGGLALGHAFKLHSGGQRRARGALPGGVEADRELPVARRDRGMGKAEAARRGLPRRHIHRAQQLGGDIGARAPVFGHRQVDHAFALGQVHRLHRDHPVREHRDQRLARVARHDAEPRGIARRIALAVERQLEHVRRGDRARWRVPARLEAHRRGDIVAARALHHQLVSAPVQICAHPDRLGAQRRRPAGNCAARGHRLPVPVAVELVPLVARLDPVHPPVHLHRHRPQIRPDRLQQEAGLRALRQGAVELGPDADHRPRGRDRAAQRALHRAARAFGDPQRHPRLLRLALPALGQGQRQLRASVTVAAQIRREGLGLRVGLGVVAPEAVARQRLERGLRDQRQLTFDGQVRPRRAKKIACLEREPRRRVPHDRPLGQRQIDVDALWHEVLDQHRLRDQRRGVGVGEERQPPRAARHRGRERQAEDMAPRHALVRHEAGVFDPVGPGQHRGQRHATYRLHLCVAQERRGVDGLARAVGAAVGGKEGIKRPGRRTPLDPAIREIKGRIGERQEGDVFVAALGGQQRRGGPAGAARQPGGKAHHAVSVGRGHPKRAVGPRQQRHLEPFERRRIRKPAGDHRKHVIPGQRRQPDIGEHEPLRRARLLVGIGPGHPRGQRIDPRRQIAHHLAHRQTRRDVGVEPVLDLAFSGPDLFGQFPGKALLGPGRKRAAEIVVLHGADQVAVRDPAQGQIDVSEVHRLDRQPGIGALGQHVGPAREGKRGRAVAHIGGDRHVADQRVALRRGQARPEGQIIALAMLHPGDADAPLVRDHRQLRIRQPHEGRVFLPGADQIFGKLGADPGRGAVGLDHVFGDAEAVLRDGPVQRLSDLIARRQPLGRPQRRHHEPPLPAGLERLGQLHQRGGALRLRPGPQVGIDRGQQRPALVGLRLAAIAAGCGIGPRQPRVVEPELCRVGLGERSPRPAQRVAQVALRLGTAGGITQLFDAPLPAGMPHADCVGLCARRNKLAGIEEPEITRPCLCPGKRLGPGGDDLGRDRAVIGFALGHAGLGEAGVRTGVEGKGRTGRIAEAERLARLERGVEERLQVAAEEVRIATHDQAALGHHRPGLLRGGRCCGAGRRDQSEHQPAHAAISS